MVSDYGFTSPTESFECQIKSLYNIPSRFPVKVMAWYAKHKAHFDFKEAEPIEQVKNVKVPILFVQGAENQMVSEYVTHKLYDACASKKQLLIVPKANHGESIAYNPEGYHYGILNLINR